MKHVIIRIASLLSVAALLTGCYGEIGPVSPAGQIDFMAGMMLMDDGTRTATLMTADSIPRTFSVFSLLNDRGATPVFDGTTVTYNSVYDSWSYPGGKGWEWSRPTDRYDFIAVSPASAGAIRWIDAPGRLTARTDYDVSSDNYDLMASMYTRSATDPDRLGAVHFAFRHMLSAVRVDITNISSDKSLTLHSYQFKNVVVSATLKANYTAAGKESYLWVNSERSSTAVRREDPPAGTHNPCDPGDALEGSGFNLFIPQQLDDSEDVPVLEFMYTPENAAKPDTVSVELPEIKRSSDDTPITEWQMGVKYIYEIRIRLDGGVEINVKTVDWNKEVYETPGIIIPVED